MIAWENTQDGLGEENDDPAVNVPPFGSTFLGARCVVDLALAVGRHQIMAYLLN
jgi:hypothetical protein